MPSPHPAPPRPLRARQQFSCCFSNMDLNPFTCSDLPVYLGACSYMHTHARAHTGPLPGSSPFQKGNHPSCTHAAPPPLQPPLQKNWPGRQGTGKGGGGLRGHVSHREPFLVPHPLPSATFLCQGRADDTRESIKCHPRVRSCHNIIKALDLRDEAVAINSESD